MRVNKRFTIAGSAVCAAFLMFSAGAAEIGESRPIPEDRKPEPVVAPASDEGLLNIRKFTIAPGFKVNLVAAEPMLANPVAFCIDWKGRWLVSETHRYRSSVLDIRHYMFMLEDDLASRHIDDRVALTRKHFGEQSKELAIESEVVRLIEDSDGDYKADKSVVFAGRFDTQLDGIASGVLARKGKVYFTNIPHLWELTDTDDDGSADVRRSLSYGYGVRFSYTGHDLHGLAVGPDGKLYFSFGDRGAHVKTQEGEVLALPDEGAVFRCNFDGSELELVHRGLRNPQELAFDNYGNLFTGDNDCDNGDSERWVQVVEGGESGWRVGYQHAPLGQAGPWMSERLWVPRFDGQAAYILPPIANIMDGPSGLTFNPGTGFPAEYDNHFFLAHFKGQASVSGISTFRVEPRGASFDLVEMRKFIWNCLPTDVDFGYDGSLYFTDWHHDWPKSGKGRIYRVHHPDTSESEITRDVKDIFEVGFDQRIDSELGRMLMHPDKRVRQEAQFTLADRKAAGELTRTARNSSQQLARLHGIWGLGQIAREDPEVLQRVMPLLADEDPEIRAQAAKVSGDGGYDSASNALIRLLHDESNRVRFFAAMSLGKLKVMQACGPVIEMIRSNADRDLYLRHAGVMALVWIGNQEALAAAAADADRSVRLAAVLALRRLRDPEVAHLLDDADPAIALEAARAINDYPVNDALPVLASLAGKVPQLNRFSSGSGDDPDLRTPMLLRVVNANFRVGKPGNAQALAALAADDRVLDKGRTEALHALATWAEPFQRDRIVGVYRPLENRRAEPAIQALRPVLGDILRSGTPAVRIAAAQAAAALQIGQAAPLLLGMVKTDDSARVRVGALKALEKLDRAALAAALEAGAGDKSMQVRKEAARLLTSLKPADAVGALAAILKNGSIPEKQGALNALGSVQHPGADELLASWVQRLLEGNVPNELHLDLLEAAGQRKDEQVTKQLKAYAAASKQGGELADFMPVLHGGDAEAGRRIFYEKVEVSCLRCHKLNGQGGDVGPPQDDVGKRATREYLLESIVLPNRKIAEGYETIVVETRAGESYSGIVKKETDSELHLEYLEDGLFETTVKLKKSDIKKRGKGLSGMPSGMGQLLTKRELRDLIEFLASLK